MPSLSDRLTPEQRERIRQALDGARQDVAEVLGLSPELVRANIFEAVDGHLALVADLTSNMSGRPQELTLTVEPGQGAVGTAYATGEPVLALGEAGWSGYLVGADQADKPHPELRWILSMPVPTRSSTEEPLFVLSVDGIRESRSPEELARALERLSYWSLLILALAGTR